MALLGLDELKRERELDTLRPEIGASWGRSVSLGLEPDRLHVLAADPDLESRFVSAAEPVVQNVADDLAAMEISVVLTDARANVLVRSDGGRVIRRELDRVSIAPGYTYSEVSAGTNAIGTTLACGTPVRVFGREHFSEELTDLSCAAAPINDPHTGQIVGALDLTCRDADDSPLMLSFARTAAREIEDRLRHDSAGARLVTAQRAAWESLTASERQVARAVGQGLTNREVADRLFCSPYTVDSHLRSIFRKLAVTSRVSLAAQVAQLDPA